MSDWMQKTTFEFAVVEERTVVNTTVKIVAQIVGIIAVEKSEDLLRNDIRAMMTGFIDAEWQFANTVRSLDNTGLERISMTATARVGETENHALDRRAAEVSKPGLTIVSVSADTSIPQNNIDAAERDLRAALFAKVNAECKELSAHVGSSFFVSSIRFGPAPMRGTVTHNAMATIASGSLTKSGYGSGFGDEGDTLGSAHKLAMQASVVLTAHNTV